MNFHQVYITFPILIALYYLGYSQPLEGEGWAGYLMITGAFTLGTLKDLGEYMEERKDYR